MSVHYKAVLWNRQKRLYDGLILLGILTYLSVFLGAGTLLRPQATVETLLIRGLGTLALFLLHVVLSIGPLARLDSRFLPLLYNRRHLGVATFLCGLAHGLFALVQFHALGDRSPLVSLLSSNTRFDSLSEFPFELLGLAALLILFLMAATSHDFWLANLSAPVWKSLHMLVYLAYGLLIVHVALGVLQAETHPVLTATLSFGFLWVVSLHLVAFGKRGAGALVSGLDGRAVRVTGSLIYDERKRMIEVHEIEPLHGATDERLQELASSPEHQLGTLTLTGEIVDAKCYLGAMKPGRGKAHKACAIRCISGGVPPVLRVEDREGRVELLLLVSAAGEPVNREVLHLVAEPVEITGEVIRSADTLVLRADPSTYRRVGS